MKLEKLQSAFSGKLILLLNSYIFVTPPVYLKTNEYFHLRRRRFLPGEIHAMKRVAHLTGGVWPFSSGKRPKTKIQLILLALLNTKSI
jgi:hypothetical protein